MNFLKYFRIQLADDTIQAVHNLLVQENISWEQLPWQIQFLPSIIKHIAFVGVANVINPDIDGISGLTGASKVHLNTKVYSRFRPRDIVFTAEESIKNVLPLIKKKKLEFPLFIKPVIGERAAGVQFLPTEDSLFGLKLELAREYLLEEAILSASEFCISVVRDIKTQKFKIFSLAERAIPMVIGDGKNTIKILIESLAITDLQKSKIIASLESDFLDTVLPDEQSQAVVRTASISYGTEYINLEPVLTKVQRTQLQQQINKALDNATGFNIGRFDIKADTLQDICEGNFKVIELNGIGGMPTHVYEKNISIEQKQKILDQYFMMLGEFAHAMVKSGKTPSGFWSAFKHLFVCVRKQQRGKDLKRLEQKYFWRVVKNLFQIRWSRSIDRFSV